MKKTLKKIVVALACACLSVGTIFTAYADENSTKNLEIICKSDDVILENLEISIYRCAEIVDNDYKFTTEFENTGVDLDYSSASAFQTTADSLANVVVTDNFVPTATSVSDQQGKVNFSNLENGLYLVCGKSVEVELKNYKLSPMFVEIKETSDNTVVSYGKFSVTDVEIPQPTEYKVVKIWENEKDVTKYRPESISVEIYFNGELFYTVTLSEENDWTASWTSDNSGEWNVKELSVPDEYAVTYKNDGTTYTVVNKLDDSYTNTPPTDNPPTTDTDTDTDIDTDKDIPQTGQLWWPVPILVIVGLLCVIIGLKLHSKGENN